MQAVHPISDLQIEDSRISRGPETTSFPILMELGIGVPAYGVGKPDRRHDRYDFGTFLGGLSTIGFEGGAKPTILRLLHRADRLFQQARILCRPDASS